MFELFTDIPFVSLFVKFMVASTAMFGAVWLLEKTSVINTPDLAELAWKLAIAGSFIAVLPIMGFMSPTVVVENASTASLIQQLNEDRPLSGYSSREQFRPVFAAPVSEKTSLTGAPEFTVSPDFRAVNIPNALQNNAFGAPKPAPLPPIISTQNIVNNAQNAPIIFNPEGDSELLSEPTIWQSIVELRAKDLAALGWVGLALLTLLALMFSYRDAVKNLGSRKRVQAENNANKVLREICEKADIKHVPYLSRSSDINSPVCLPRREICLPDWAFENMPEAEFRSLLAHELGHMVRRDPIMLMALQMLSRIFFFQPLFIMARKRLTDVAELAADEWAAKQASDSRAVANALFICATKIHETRQIQWGLAMAGNKSILKRRVERLIEAQSVPFKTASKFAKSALVVGVVGLSLGLPSIEFAGAHPTEDHDMSDFIVDIDHDMLRDLNVIIDHEHLRGIERGVLSGLDSTISLAVSTALESVSHVMEDLEHGGRSLHVVNDDDDSGNIIWHDDDMRVSVNWDGSFRVSDNDDTIIANDDYGTLRIKTREGGEKRAIKFEAEDGKTVQTYWKDGKKHELDADGKKWLKRTIGKLVAFGFGAEQRVARLLKSKGVKGVIADIKGFDSDWAKRIYLAHLIEAKNLKDSEIKLIVGVVAKMDSDFDKRLTLSHLLEDEKVSDKMLPQVLKIAKGMESDFEKRLLVSHVVSKLKLTKASTKIVIDIAESMDSDFEIRLLLTAALSDADLDSKHAARLFDLAVEKIDSDFEMRVLLTSFADHFGSSDVVVAKVLKAVKKMDSDFESRLLLSTLINEAKPNQKNWLLAIERAADLDSNHEKRLVFMQIQNEIPEDNKKIKAAFDKAIADVDMGRYAHTEDHYEYRSEGAEEWAESVREIQRESAEAVREALRGFSHSRADIQRETERAMRDVERELSRIQRDQSQVEGREKRELARAAKSLERTKRALERSLEKSAQKLEKAQKALEGEVSPKPAKDAKATKNEKSI